MDDGLIDCLFELFGALIEIVCEALPGSWGEKKRRNE